MTKKEIKLLVTIQVFLLIQPCDNFKSRRIKKYRLLTLMITKLTLTSTPFYGRKNDDTTVPFWIELFLLFKKVLYLKPRNKIWCLTVVPNAVQVFLTGGFRNEFVHKAFIGKRQRINFYSPLDNYIVNQLNGLCRFFFVHRIQQVLCFLIKQPKYSR